MRRAELAANLAAAQERISLACAAAGRDRSEVELIVVTKTWPVSDLAHLAALGVRHFGESREQEAHAKWDHMMEGCHSDGMEPTFEPAITWHFIGRIQRNKAGRIGEWADVIHSIDRAEILEPLTRAGRSLQGLIQVSLDEDLERGGVLSGGVEPLADAVVASGIRLRGVMAVAPLGQPPAPHFRRLREIRDRLVRSHPDATWISAGMSGDLEEAIAEGATHVRLGTSILGSRY